MNNKFFFISRSMRYNNNTMIDELLRKYRRTKERIMSRIACGTVWGGIRDTNLRTETAAITASIFSHAADGGKGGDVYFFSVCSGDKLSRIVIGDVTGHGEKVSQIGLWLYDSLLKYKNIYGEHHILTDLNQTVTKRGLEALSTMASISYYKKDGNLYFSYAGHPPVMILRNNQPEWEEVKLDTNDLQFSNIPLGISDKANYMQNSIPLHSGDKLVLYTDGVLEAPNREWELFGSRRLKETLQSLNHDEPETIKNGVIEALKDHTSGQLNHDDITLIAIHIN